MLVDKKYNFDTSIRFLKGIGPERARLLEELGVTTIREILAFYPRRYENRFPLKKISELEGSGQKECVQGRLASLKTIRTRSGRVFVRAFLVEGRARLFVSWFNALYLSKSLKTGARVVLWGKVDRSGTAFQMIHPEWEIADGAHSFHYGRIVPIYPLVEDLSQKSVRGWVFSALEEFGPRVRERLATERLKELRLMGLAEALREIHFPSSEAAYQKARQRLVFDEFLVLQLVVGLRRLASRVTRNDLIQRDSGRTVERWVDSLGFELTEGQRRVIREITADLQRTSPMNRLLQADVGSGKTLVAAAAILHTVSNGFQAAFMAPTEVLARQQMFALCRDLEPAGVRLGYLGPGADSQRAETLKQLQRGELDGVVGTHALLGEQVRFSRLGLVVVDEQHKFGVAQRAALRDASGKPVHYLMLTATPIPRTLAMTLYGDLDVSEMHERPRGRALVRTARVDSGGRESAYAFAAKIAESGGRVFVVCPALSKESGGMRSAVTLARELTQRFPALRVGCLHGKLKSPEKERLVKQFRSGEIQMLVCTVVIEVGIDVPDAQAVLIENAERFGMAQLHQLRGRVGRGSREGYCFLLSSTDDEETLERLDALCQMSSGFAIAENDLERRGSGDWLDRKQHGWMELSLGDFARDREELRLARLEASRILSEDPDLTQPAHRVWRRQLERKYPYALTGAATA